MFPRGYLNSPQLWKKWEKPRQVAGALEAYFDGLHRCDVERLKDWGSRGVGDGLEMFQ
jgi:hypothetical protein